MPLGYDVPSARQRRAARPPLGGGCRRRRLGERNCRAISLPPSALRAATSLAERGKGKRIPTPVRALARNDRGTGRTGASAPTEQNKSRAETGRRGRRPLRSDRGTGRTGASAPTERNKSLAETGRRGRRPLRAALRVHVHKGMRIPAPVTRSLALIDILFGKTEPRGVRRGALFVYAYTQFSCTGSSGFCSTVTRISPVRWLSTRVTCTRSP